MGLLTKFYQKIDAQREKGLYEAAQKAAREYAKIDESLRGVEAALQRLESQKEVVAQAEGLQRELIALKKQITDLTIERDKKVEDLERRERETLHMVGLVRKQTEFETNKAKAEAILQVREEALAADKARFQETIAFTTKRFEEQLKSQQTILDSILERLPNVNVEKLDVTQRRSK